MTHAQKTVMIIEDEPDIAELFAEMMRLNGYRVIKAYTGTPAMTLIPQEKPDVILLDIMMPDVSGLEVLRYVRQDSALASIPVIVVSALSMPMDIQKGLEAGATVYLSKPVSYTDLLSAVDRLAQVT